MIADILRCVVSTVGTSLLTNPATPEERKRLLALANTSDDNLEPDDQALIARLADAAGRALAGGDIRSRRKLSAELNGIYGLYKDRLDLGRHDMHVLIATDTAQGKATAQILADFLRGQGMACDIPTFARLSTGSQQAFSYGMRRVILWCHRTLRGYRESGYRVVFNLVGSFKALQGYMNTIGMFHADEMVYLFEGSDEIINIPRLPVRLDIGSLADQREAFALMHAGLPLSRSELTDWPGTLIEDYDGDHCLLSEWGELVWSDESPALLADRLLRLPGLLVTPAFEKDFEECNVKKDRIALQESLAKVSTILTENGGDVAALKRDGGLQYENLDGKHRALGHFRVDDRLRVTCRPTSGGLVLERFLPHAEFDRIYR